MAADINAANWRQQVTRGNRAHQVGRIKARALELDPGLRDRFGAAQFDDSDNYDAIIAAIEITSTRGQRNAFAFTTSNFNESHLVDQAFTKDLFEGSSLAARRKETILKNKESAATTTKAAKIVDDGRRRLRRRRALTENSTPQQRGLLGGEAGAKRSLLE